MESDSRIQKYVALPTPKEIMIEPKTTIVADTRKIISDIIHGKDDRLLLFIGPCSIHNEISAIEYAKKLRSLQEELPNLVLVMRFFVQKPRTTVGWTGFLEDPELNGTNAIACGLRRTVNLANAIVHEVGIPICTEMLGTTIEPQYLNPYLSAGFIGARTSESQIHRNLASGVSFPVGIKNSSDGCAETAYQGVLAARVPRSFCGVDVDGRICAVHTTGNEDTCVVLRGSYKNGPNIESGLDELKDKECAIIVDCAHGNSNKNLETQKRNAINVAKNQRVCGIMVESHLKDGKQPCSINSLSDVSVTDPCIGWDDTVILVHKIAEAHYDKLKIKQENKGKRLKLFH